MEINRRTVINASPDHVWSLLGPGFADIGSWFSGVLTSEAIPRRSVASIAPVEGRVCVTPEGEVTETITEYDEDARRFAFVIDQGLPGFVVLAGNAFAVADLGEGRTELRFKVTIELKPWATVLLGWMFKRKVNETADQIIEDFVAFAETGSASDRKQKVTDKFATQRAA